MSSGIKEGVGASRGGMQGRMQGRMQGNEVKRELGRKEDGRKRASAGRTSREGSDAVAVYCPLLLSYSLWYDTTLWRSVCESARDGGRASKGHWGGGCDGMRGCEGSTKHTRLFLKAQRLGRLGNGGGAQLWVVAVVSA